MPRKLDTAERIRTKGGTLRSSARIEHSVSVGISPEAFDADSYKTPPPIYFGLLQNISQNGLCIDTPGEYQLHQVISLFLRLTQDSSGIMMLGKIIWLEPEQNGKSRLGIQFIGNLPADWKNLLPKDDDGK